MPQEYITGSAPPVREKGYNEQLGTRITFALARTLTVHQYGEAPRHKGLPPEDKGAPMIDDQGRKIAASTSPHMARTGR